MMKSKKKAELKIQQLNEEGIFKTCYNADSSIQNFYPAEDYHQDYYKKNPAHYEQYQRGSGRKSFIETHWGLKMIKKIKMN